MEQLCSYPVEQLTKARGRLILAWMLLLEPGYLPGRDALLQPCVSWITLHTDGKNKLKNSVLDLFTHWAAFPCVTELTTKTVISPWKGSSCSGLCTLLKLMAMQRAGSALLRWKEPIACRRDNSGHFSLML